MKNLQWKVCVGQAVIPFTGVACGRGSANVDCAKNARITATERAGKFKFIFILCLRRREGFWKVSGFLAVFFPTWRYLYHVWNTQAWHGRRGQSLRIHWHIHIHTHGHHWNTHDQGSFDRNLQNPRNTQVNWMWVYLHNNCTALGTWTFERWLASETEKPVGKNLIDEWKFDMV